MASVSDNVMRFFRSSSNQDCGSAAPQKLSRRSSGMGEISRLLNSQEGLCVLDMGRPRANNIRFFTGKGHKNYSEDLLRSSLDPALRIQDSEPETGTVDSKKFLEENLQYPNAHFDVVLCWNLPDYMEESLVKPTIDRLWSVMKPGGLLLAFFHTRDAGPGFDLLSLSRDRHRYAGDAGGEIRAPGRPASEKQSPRLQRVFNNRHIENLFPGFRVDQVFPGARCDPGSAGGALARL
jgi:SAM-dependent methyltransferase